MRTTIELDKAEYSTIVAASGNPLAVYEDLRLRQRRIRDKVLTQAIANSDIVSKYIRGNVKSAHLSKLDKTIEVANVTNRPNWAINVVTVVGLLQECIRLRLPWLRITDNRTRSNDKIDEFENIELNISYDTIDLTVSYVGTLDEIKRKYLALFRYLSYHSKKLLDLTGLTITLHTGLFSVKNNFQSYKLAHGDEVEVRLNLTIDLSSLTSLSKESIRLYKLAIDRETKFRKEKLEKISNVSELGIIEFSNTFNTEYTAVLLNHTPIGIYAYPQSQMGTLLSKVAKGIDSVSKSDVDQIEMCINSTDMYLLIDEICTMLTSILRRTSNVLSKSIFVSTES